MRGFFLFALFFFIGSLAAVIPPSILFSALIGGLLGYTILAFYGLVPPFGYAPAIGMFANAIWFLFAGIVNLPTVLIVGFPLMLFLIAIDFYLALMALDNINRKLDKLIFQFGCQCAWRSL